MDWVCNHIKAKGLPEQTTLHQHLLDVSDVCIKIAEYLGLNPKVAKYGAIIHDIGKASSVFQQRLLKSDKNSSPFRHEIASLFFLSLFPIDTHEPLIEMIIGHHKSVKMDSRGKGILDLEENRNDTFQLHIKDFDDWKNDALAILKAFGINSRDISIEEAKQNYHQVIEYCEKAVREQGYSEWRGLLMAADHFASALSDNTEDYLKRIFIKPNLNFFNRQHPLFPLSLKESISNKPHTMVVACTGAGKTDYLFRRCHGRVFYILPFQASINAMYKRVSNDLKDDNPDLDIRVLHSSSSIVVEAKCKEEKIIQGHVGSSIKILTPHQIAAIAFGTNGFESIIIDLKGCDVILDEIHTYTDITRSIVLKIVEVLKSLGCRIHIGTATMPSILYDRIIDILGSDNVLEVKLEKEELNLFNRHTIHKINAWEDVDSIVKNAINDDKKVLVVCNRVRNAQDKYKLLEEQYPEVPILLLHSRYKRGDRNNKEYNLIGLNEKGESLGIFNTSNKACIVVSTQVVEVSIDISFDLMVTEAAPLDALIQRFGRINRKRNSETLGKYKPIYVLAPPEDKKQVLPYSLEIVSKSYEMLPDNEVLTEDSLQEKIDSVFTKIDFLKIEQHSVFKENGNWTIDKLTHNSKALLLDLLDIDSVSCVCESDKDAYMTANFEERTQYEISTRFYAVKDLIQLKGYGNNPFIIPDSAYSAEIGFEIEKAKANNYNVEYSFL